ncbi:hypothetical protein [Proteus mirabilis]|uniref:hypothetical protein n=1 Tax=Proteus mirabilis TaxID=584 RepID=UPI0029DFE008|nr:hypothetical protein [Proteus mirabilis]HEK1185049.1 hypothetical protein [Proteus mirabilis]HEK1975253.1 hypothetical protein [Proteus mirabilis]
MNIYDLSSLKLLSDEPDADDDLYVWYQQREICDFLSSDEGDEYILLYASLPHVFLHAIFLPDTHAQKDSFASLIHWSGGPYSSWGISCSSNDVTIEKPLSNFGEKSLSYGEQIIFARSFEGVNGSETYYEINQKIAHSLDLHYVSERKSWCKLNAHGEIDEVIKIINISVENKEVGTVICAKNIVLGEYAGIESYKLFRMFDFTRYKSGEFNGWGSKKIR